MNRKLLWYLLFFVALLVGFWYFVFRDVDLSKSNLAVINNVDGFSFTDQNGRRVTEKDVEDKVYVAEYFFTTCGAICPRMNANMRRVFDKFKDEKNFMILSHTCMPEKDSVPVLKAYEIKMINGTLVKKPDDSYRIDYDSSTSTRADNPNWLFLTGDKTALYDIARHGYLIDNNKPDSMQNISNQFIHTQLFALVDKERRVRGIYDGLVESEIQKLLTDIKGLLKEKVDHKRFMNGFSNNPN